jgi:3-oxoacyl-[acyl-carrier protein] reductase
MDLQLRGKTALVTGASSGIGRAIAKALAAEGVKLCIAGRRRDALEQLATDVVAQSGPQPEIWAADIMEEGAPQSLARDALTRLGQINILINCAGGITHMTLESPEQAWRDVMTLNYTRPRELTIAVVPDMIQHKWGRIINVSGSSEPKGVEAGSAPKAAVHGFAKGLSREVARHGITVNSLSPGPGKIDTEMTRRLYSEQWRKEFSEKEIPVGRFGTPEEFAYLAVCLVSPLASYITGNVIHVDGGAHRFAFT